MDIFLGFKSRIIFFNIREKKKKIEIVKIELKYILEIVKNINDIIENKICYLEIKIEKFL